jgi:P4 family phage/plasmid primase-like protien
MMQFKSTTAPKPTDETPMETTSSNRSTNNNNDPSPASALGYKTINDWADFWRYDIGINIIPADTKNKTTTIRWSEYQDKPIPEWQHEQWKKEGAFNRGIAIILGKVWHNKKRKDLYFIFLDVDKRLAIDELCTRNSRTITLQEMSDRFLVEQHEDNIEKAHIYFYSPIPFPKKSADSALGLEVKGLGEHGIAFCSPSIHKDGKPYEIIGTNQPIVITREQTREMIQHLNQICIKYGIPYLEKVSRLGSELKSMAKNLEVNHNIRIAVGQRHTTLISLADSLLFNHLAGGKNAVGEIKSFFDQINDELCEPPLSWDERDSIWKSALDFVYKINASQGGKIKKDEKEENVESGYGDLVVSIAEELMQNHTFATMNDTGEIYYYDAYKGMYLPGGEILIETEAEESENRILTYKVNEIINKIKRRTYKSRTEFDRDLDLLNLKNGLLNVITGELVEHSSEYLSLVQLPINYDPKAKCPNILRFLGQVLRPKDVFTVLQLFGYCLLRTAKYEKAVMCCGLGDNGKGTLLKLVERFLGEQNVSHASIQELNNDRFAIADLHGKLANVCADLKAEKLTNTGTFKMLASGDTIRAQKKHGQSFDFRNIAKLIFSANEIPESDDQTYAYFKRWIILLFDRVFLGEDKDTNLIGKLTTDEELSGLLNLAIIALRQLIKENGFIHVDNVHTIQREYNQNATATEDFFNSRCRLDVTNRDYYTICRDLYHSYIVHCKNNNRPHVPDNVFGSHLIAKGIKKERRMVNRTREYCYIGVSVSQ